MFQPSSYRQERAAIISLYAAKIAAARMTARHDQIARIVEALRGEERAALRALDAKAAFERETKQEAAKLQAAYRAAAIALTTRSHNEPERPKDMQGQARGRHRNLVR